MEIGRHILDLDTDTESVYRHLVERDIVVDNLARCISATVAWEEQAELLRRRSREPLLRVRMAASDQYGRIISFADHCFPRRTHPQLNTVRGTPRRASPPVVMTTRAAGEAVAKTSGSRSRGTGPSRSWSHGS